MHNRVDWKKAPKDAVWWAVDANGRAHWFNAPTAVAFTTFWLAEQQVAPRFDYEGDWRESLTKKPDRLRSI